MTRKNNGSKNPFWDEILSGEKTLSDKEAEEMLRLVKNLRKEYGFRKINYL